MAQHVLSLEAPDTLNLCILRVIDTSIYNPDMAPRCPQLYVTLPGFVTPVVFDESVISLGFSLNLTACDLEVQTANCGTTYSPLPDGVYIIKYSVSPNETVYVEYNHLRITKALLKIQELLCDLDINACDPPSSIKQKLDKITEIKRYLDAAKAKVEFCHEPAKGMELYNYAIKMLDKMQCKTC
jgi:hypothetical protein